MNSSDLYRSYTLVRISVLPQENNRGMFIEQYWVGSPFTQWVKILNGTHITKEGFTLFHGTVGLSDTKVFYIIFVNPVTPTGDQDRIPLTISIQWTGGQVDRWTGDENKEKYQLGNFY